MHSRGSSEGGRSWDIGLQMTISKTGKGEEKGRATQMTEGLDRDKVWDILGYKRDDYGEMGQRDIL